MFSDFFAPPKTQKFKEGFSPGLQSLNLFRQGAVLFLGLINTVVCIDSTVCRLLIVAGQAKSWCMCVDAVPFYFKFLFFLFRFVKHLAECM